MLHPATGRVPTTLRCPPVGDPAATDISGRERRPPPGGAPPARGGPVLSICSGISAASRAWGPLGWKCAGFFEVEPFPSAVLAHHYPHVPNFGDLTRHDESLPDRIPIDVLEGGTPCQGFSVAGLRGGLDDPRSRLAFHFVEMAAKHRPRWLVWENVPGVFSSSGGTDFAAFLGALTGRDIPVPPDGWRNSGHVAGIPSAYGVAWRVLDAQYCGVPQRRRRIFLVGYLGDWRRAAAVLFEPESLRGDPPPRREPGEGIAGTLTSRAGNGSRPAGANGNLTTGPLCANGKAAGSATQQDAESGMLVAHTTGAGFWQEGFGTLRAREQDSHENLVAFDCKASGRNGFGVGEVSPTLRSMGHKDSHQNAGGQVAIAFDTTQITSAENRSNPQPGDPCHPLAAGAHPPAIAFEPRCARNGRGMPSDVCPALKAEAGHTGKGDAAPCVAYTIHGTDQTASVATETDTACCLRTKPPGAFENSSTTVALSTSAVRRLTPRECERLQGFPDDYTLIPWRGKPADQCPDGPRYKALGNSVAVPVMHWIGTRIALVDAIPLA